MNSKDRRTYINGLLVESYEPMKGSFLAKKLGVTRQVVVKDIAILRAEGINIIATPEGYIIPHTEFSRIVRIIAVNHKPEEIEDELKTIVTYGAVVKDVIIEHALYGEIRGMLMLKSLHDVDNFIIRLKEKKAEPLSKLTGGVHLHTIETEDEESMNNVIEELKKKGYLVLG